MSIKDRCRLCLAHDESNYFDIFSPELKAENFGDKVRDCLQIEIKESDEFPKQVCESCYSKIDSFICYREQCQLNQTVFSIYRCKTDVAEEVEVQNDTTVVEGNHENVVVTNESTQQNFRKRKNDNPSKLQEAEIVKSDSESEPENKGEPPGYQSPLSFPLPQDFPKLLIKNSRLTICGKELTNLISQFYRLECDLCGKITIPYTDISSLLAHYKQVHNIKGFVVCCGVKLFKPKVMAMHMARHLQPEAFLCHICHKSMTSPKILQAHLELHLPENQRKFACKHCPRRFAYNSALLAHSISHISQDKRKIYECNECNKVYYSSGRLSTHMSHVHVKQGNEFICHMCAKQFTCKSNLAYHLKTHQPVQLAQCKECGKWLRNKICLRKHLDQHSNVKHKCQLCDYAAVNIQCLKNHMRTKHSQLKPFRCSQCPKSFKLKNTLVSHMAQHTGEKRYSCEFCNRKFVSSGNYYAHRKRMHASQVQDKLAQKETEEAIKRQTHLGVT